MNSQTRKNSKPICYNPSMQEMDDPQHIIQEGKLTGTSFNPNTNVLTSWEVNPQTQTHRRVEQHLLRGMRRITTETIHPHIGIPDVSTIAENRTDDTVKRVTLEQHGELKRITASISFLGANPFFAISLYGESGKIYSFTVIILDKNIPTKQITCTQRGGAESLEVVDKFGETLVDREIDSTISLELSLPGVDIAVSKRPHHTKVGLKHNDNPTEISFRRGIDFQAACDTILSAEYEKWSSVLNMIAPNKSTA